MGFETDAAPTSPSREMEVTPLRYAAIATSDREWALALYRDALGMEIASEDALEPEIVAALYGADAAGPLRRTMLAQPGIPFGMVQLLMFEPACAAAGLAIGPADHGLIKTLDVFVEDYERATRGLSDCGFGFVRPPRVYDGGSGLQATEGQVDAPDGVALAILSLARIVHGSAWGECFGSRRW